MTRQVRTLKRVSKTEQVLDSSAADDALDELTSDELGDDALDESLVESIEEYVADDGAIDDVDELSYSFEDVDDESAETEPADEIDDAAAESGDEIDDAAAATDDVEVDTDEDHDDAVDEDVDEDVDDVVDDVVDESESTVFEDDDFTDDDYEDDDQTFDVPKIVMATESDDDVIEAVDGAESRAEPDVSDDILEELRRADIDGPIVEMAPQDDTTSARRRPKRAIDYDPAPVPIPLKVPRILGRKPRVRKVTRVVRHVDPWSVFKIAIIANMVLYGIVLTASVLLWNVAYATGTVENVERFFESFGWQSFEFNGGEIYHSAWIAGLFVVVGLTGLAVLFATLFNLITDLVGGVRFTVLEEEVVESRTSPMRRFVVRRPEPDIPAVISDPSGSIIREAVVDDTGDIPR